jgi:glycosyltransferase 2 family protein
VERPGSTVPAPAGAQLTGGQAPEPGGTGRTVSRWPAGRRVLRTVLAAAFLAATTVMVVVALHGQDWHSLHRLWRPGAVPVLLAAMGLNLAGLTLSMVSWRYLLVALNGPLGFAACSRIYFAGLLGAFLPGTVWGVVVHVRLGTRAGISAARMAATYVASVPVGVLGGAAVGLLVAAVLPGGQLAWLALPTAVVLACLAWPSLVYRLTAAMARIARRSPPPRVPDQAIRRSIAANLLAWLISGLHLWLIVLLLGAPAWKALPVSIGGFALAVTAGGLAVLVPNGLGVREAVLGVTLSAVLPWRAAVAAAVASRILVILTEVLGAVTAMAAAWMVERRAHVG